MKSVCFILFLATVPFLSSAKDVDHSKTADSYQIELSYNKLLLVSPPLINDNFMSMEYGFIGRKSIKKWNFYYNSFVSAFVFERKMTSQDVGISTDDPNQTIRGGSLGVKAGLIIPTNPLIGLSLFTALGYGKTTIQKDPWFGKLDGQLRKTELYLAELGILYYYKKLLIRPSVWFSNLSYLKQKFYLSFGINF